MTSRRRIVIVDDEESIRTLLVHTLPRDEFELFTFGEAPEALRLLPELRPDLILCDVMMPDMDGHTFFQEVKRLDGLRQVPFLFLSAVSAPDAIVASMEAGADDFVNKPFSPARLLAKVRAVLRLAGRTAPYAEERRQDALSGELGPRGTLPLVKFCETVRLSGRLSVTALGVERWAAFLGGELVAAGGEPDAPGEEPIDLLLAMGAGHYEITQNRLDPAALAALSVAEASTAPPAEEAAPAHPPGGLLTRLDVRGESVTVQTEAENRPDFTVTTVITRAGHVIRKIESGWPHPLQRRDDQSAAEAHVHRQHERVTAAVRELQRPAPGAGAARVDGALLAWAVSFVAEQARDLLGAVMTVALLRRTHKRAAQDYDVLRELRLGPDGRVTIDPARAALPPVAVRAVAAWLRAFLEESGAMVEKAGKIRVRQATRMMENDLERLGFYTALGEAPGP